jgi:ribosomal protein S18 acetylase RimI-like enzyme
VEIRPLTSEERTEAVALWRRTGLIRPWNPPEEDFDRATTGSSSAVLGGFAHGTLAATAMVGHDGHRGWVYYVAVDPERRSAGLGRAMMQAAEAWVRDAGVPKLQLMVRSGNAGALGFYESLGFAVEETAVLSRWLEPDGPGSPV